MNFESWFWGHFLVDLWRGGLHGIGVEERDHFKDMKKTGEKIINFE